MAGTMVPMGDAKGATLAVMVELLCAGLTGANFATETTSFFDAEGAPPGTGQLLIAIDPAAFGDGATARFAALAAMIDGVEGARVPGRRRHDLRAAMERDGVPVEPDLIAAIEAIGR